MSITRRNLVKLGAGTALASGLSGWGSLLAQQDSLITATIPSSGQLVPAVGLGARNYRARTGSTEIPVFRDTLATFHRLGGKVLDTSPNYGNSEAVVGDILRELGIRDDLFIATKVDRGERRDGMARMERSFKLLGGDDFALMQVHNLRGVEVQLETMKEWKEQGRFHYIGITTSNARQYDALEQLMNKHTLDFIQIDYSLGNRGAAERVLPLAMDKGIAVLVNLPFGRGRLFDAVGNRALPDWAADIDANSWAQVFLKYIISHPASTIPIPGTTKPHHAEDNILAAIGRLPDASIRSEMESFIDPLLA